MQLDLVDSWDCLGSLDNVEPTRLWSVSHHESVYVAHGVGLIRVGHVAGSQLTPIRCWRFSWVKLDTPIPLTLPDATKPSIASHVRRYSILIVQIGFGEPSSRPVLKNHKCTSELERRL